MLNIDHYEWDIFKDVMVALSQVHLSIYCSIDKRISRPVASQTMNRLSVLLGEDMQARINTNDRY